MNLSQLCYFRALVECGRFSKAAKNLYVTQPTLSNSIGKLEKELGVTLFMRGQNGVSLTENGKKFERHVSVALSEIDKAVASVHGSADGSGVVRIATTDSIQRNYLPAFLGAFQQNYENVVEYDVSTSNTFEAIHGLRDGRYDVAFCAALPLEDLDAISLIAQNLVVYVNVEHPLANKASVTLSDLEEYEGSLVTYNADSVMNRLIGNMLRNLSLSYEEKFATEIDASSLISVESTSVAVALDTVEDVVFPLVKTVPIAQLDTPFHIVSLVVERGIPHNACVLNLLEFARNNSLVDSDVEAFGMRFWTNRDKRDLGL